MDSARHDRIEPIRGLSRLEGFREEGFHDGEAGVDDAKEGFKAGEEGDEGVDLPAIGADVFVRDADADNGYDADARGNVSEARILRGGEAFAYTTPNPNIKLKTTFLFIAICKPQSTGMGKITTVTSNSKLTIPM